MNSHDCGRLLGAQHDAPQGESGIGRLSDRKLRDVNDGEIYLT